MNVKVLPKGCLYEADCLQQRLLNPEKKKRYRKFSYIKKQHAENHKLFIGCYDHNKLVGIIFGYAKKDEVLLGEFAIDKAYRKKGLGKKMLSLFETQVKATGKKRIILGSKANSEKFYLSRGYTPLLFVQIRHKEVPKSYNCKGYNIIKETNYPDAKRLFIQVKKYDPKMKAKAKKDFNAYNVIYLFKKEINRDIMNKNMKFYNIPFVLFAETHGYLNDFKLIKRIIKQQKPDYVLYELAEDRKFLTPKEFKDILRQYRLSEMTDIKDVKQVLGTCYRRHIPVIGIDFKNFAIKDPELVRKKNYNKIEPTESEMKKIMKVITKREQHQIKLIKEYQKKGKVLAITGAFHLREDSPFWRELNGLIVYPAYKDKLIYEPVVKKKSIVYKTKKL